MNRPPGMSVRWKLTLSYAGFLLLAGALLMAVVWVFLLRYVPDRTIHLSSSFVPNRSDLLRAFAPAASVAMLGLLVFGLLGGWFLAGRMLAPLRKITEATRAAGTGELSHRISMKGQQDEFRELADAFDSMMNRIEAHVGEQQRFAANASHELRTPLAITRTMLDVALQKPERSHTEDLGRLQQVNSRAIALTEGLLLLSRAGHAQINREPLDLSLVIEEATETLLPLSEKHGVKIHVSAEPSMVSGEAVLLHQLVSNLIQNAILYNLPGGGSIWVNVVHSEGAYSLIVKNTGFELSPEQLDTLTEPFQRGSQRARDAQHEGAGLGLAIVERIVRAHGAKLTLTPRAAGGLSVRIDFPEASA